ncbi:guanine deaminase [Methylopila jiangsuensis]|uniref:Guanine deaminase n=1 Tax=Methylopila jiangsuensis TaxID=586230 RepID=A0A9W6JE06_9HYPH|nr:guanine deaminase [Methylopila jiangsuensis]MDR6285489.1 guanine deaminase [Methylopila jiangsuensis]GLK75247.1 guanine deaminase [Methylopila jiangsuensis]
MSGRVAALRGATVSLRDDPFLRPSAACLEHHDDALIVIEDGTITVFGDYAATKDRLPAGVEPQRFENALITPGFIDAHVHYPQTQMIGAFGADLLGWLERYTFPTELMFADRAHAETVAALFLRALFAAGTTTAAVYGTVHAHSVDAIFAEAERFGARMIAGKVMMDRHAPEALLDTAERGYAESRALIARWHGRGRLGYAVTPRFAPSCTEAQLDAAGALLAENPGVHLQTHLAESEAEVAWVRELFPARADYLDVYARHGLAGPRSLFGHAIHLDESAFARCHACDAALVHCPSSNLFLGSGLFRLFEAVDPRRPVRVGLGSDVGAGTSLSPFRSMGDACKVSALGGRRLDAAQAFHLATLGGARALGLDDRIGRIAVGYEADLCVLDLAATPLLGFRTSWCDSVEELLFALMTLADDRMVRATYVAGARVFDRDG